MLEVGGGIGAIEIELLRAGVTRAMNVELTPTYEEAAGELLRESGLADRVERRVLDFVETGADVEAADFVVLNRVICCYPDMPRLTAAAAKRVRRTLVLIVSQLSLVDAPRVDHRQLRVSSRESPISSLPASSGVDPGCCRAVRFEDHSQRPGPTLAGDGAGQGRLASREVAPPQRTEVGAGARIATNLELV